MKNAHDYLAEKVQDLEFREQLASSSCAYWSKKYLDLLQKHGATTEQIRDELANAMAQGYTLN